MEVPFPQTALPRISPPTETDMVYRIGVIGTGIFATRSHLPAIEKNSDLEIVGCYNRTTAKAETFAETANTNVKVFSSVDELLNDSDIDTIDALLPVEQNLEIVKKSVAANKPICFEKPIAASLDDAAEIVKLAESSEVPVMVLENWCYHHGTIKLKELLPRIGSPHMFNFQVSGPFRLSPYHGTSWRQTPQHIGGFISDGGVHDLGLITEVLGPVGSVSARTLQSKPQSGTVDSLSALFNMSDGKTFGTYTQSRYSAASRPTLRFEIFGTDGSLLYEKKGFEGKITLYEGKDSTDIKESEFNLPDDEINGVLAEFANWAEVLKDGNTSRLVSTPRKAFAHYAAIAAAVHSAEKGGNMVTVRNLG